ncbi:DUF3365 domain-containing protein [Pseudoxanthomonas sp. LH2527]|uniref:c-type heme family protein n=1 Tax=Pseudoxanthomonas sp. LH2527 TaxID=2923249 RepID=UPI001F12DCDA|nr:DUF3365 domain-containing protein [Pseudoxanthomonas sp. LH2527]MCH6484421.1 DUF3365 domain-containing protein [Pseudoxanthomonas sp. LH2527]
MSAPNLRRLLWAACLAGAAGACTSTAGDGGRGAATGRAVDTPPPLSSADPDLDRAKAAAQAFSGRLRGRLQAAMQTGGPTAAVEVCQAEAPAIADAVMAEHGVRLGRVALPGRHRNAGQAAEGWQLATLEAFQQAVLAGAPAAEQVSVIREDLPEGVALRVMRGIATEPGCLACHGMQLAPQVREAIATHYPDDAATGFVVGDLRGGLWVEVPAAAPTPDEATR